jgi:hypothetical protein
MENLSVFLLILIAVLLVYGILILKQTQQSSEVSIQPVEVVTEVKEPEKPLPYWVWYGQPWYTPVYTSPYWFYDVPFYGPITGGSYQQAWGQHTRPGRGHPGPAMGGSTGVAHGGGGGGGHGGGGH